LSLGASYSPEEWAIPENIHAPRGGGAASLSWTSEGKGGRGGGDP